jgi:hypothetical protein
MELDEMQKRWAAQDKKLDEVLRLNRKLLDTERFGRARSALQRLRAGLGLELLLNAVAVFALGAFIGEHVAEPRFLLPAVVLDVAAVAILAASVRQWTLARAVDFTAPVTVSQRRLEQLRVLRIRVTQWVLLASLLLWTPLLILGLRAVFGVDAYATLGAPYLLANLAVGVAFIPLMRWAARRWAHRLEGTGWARRWAEALAGTSLTAALGQLASITDFEREGELRATPA